MKYLLLVAFIVPPASAWVPSVTRSCVEGACQSSSGGWNSSSGSGSSGQVRQSSPSWWDQRKAARHMKKILEAQAATLKMMCRFEDQASASVPATQMFPVSAGTPLFGETQIRPWLAWRLPGLAMNGSSYPPEGLRRCSAILRVLAEGSGGEPEDAAFLADQAATALAGGSLRVAIPSGGAPIENADKLAAELQALAGELQRCEAAFEEVRTQESGILYENAGSRFPEAFLPDKYYPETEPKPEQEQKLKEVMAKAEAALDAVAKEEDEICMMVAGVTRCQ